MGATGMCNSSVCLQIMELDERTVTEAIRASFAFLNKCLELQQVIDVSMRNYKAFFRWLFVVIVRLLDEQTPSEIVKITQQEQMHIAEFLYNFYSVNSIKNEDDKSDKAVRFNLERLGQYLQDQDLTLLPDDDDNPWHKFLKENPCLLKDTETIFSMSEFRKYSLVQQQHYLRDKIEKVFDVTKKDVGKHFSLVYNLNCFEDKTAINCIENTKVSQIFDVNQQRFMVALLNKSNGKDGISFMSVSVKEKECVPSAIKYYFSPSLISDAIQEETDPVTIIDLQFYSGECLSVLLQHPGSSDSTIFVQLPLKIALDNANEFNIKSRSCVFNEKISKRDISPLLDQASFKMLEKMDGYQIAVSGTRKVAVVLAKTRRKVRVFVMEVDGDDDDDDTSETTPQSLNTTQRSDSSMTTPDKAAVATEYFRYTSVSEYHTKE